MKAFLKREWRLIARQPSVYLAPTLFYFIVLSLFPMMMNETIEHLRSFALPLIWFAIALGFLSLMPHLFAKDLRTGFIEQIKIVQGDLKHYLFAKLLSVFIVVFGSMITLLPCVALMYHFTLYETLLLAITIASGGFIMSAVGLLLMIIALGLETQHGILAVMYLPLLVPVILLGALALDPFFAKIAIQLLLGSALLLSLLIVPVSDYLLRVMCYE